MIVKNESHIILETLSSVRKYIDYWVICDTGSTDNTVDLIQTFFDDESVKGEIHSEKWVDFGFNRSRVFELAFGKADYLWVIDADDILIGEPNTGQLDLDSYSIRYGRDFTYWRNQIFKGSEKWIYKGVLHEYPVCLSKSDASTGRIEGDYHVDSRRLGARNLVDPIEKYLRDTEVLESALLAEEDSYLRTRYYFYLAQSYRDAGRHALAVQWYLKRIEAGGWVEEVWNSKYEVAKAYQTLGNVEFAKKFYLDAFEFRPSRAESLYALGKLCNESGEFFQAYVYLNHASSISRTGDVLFVAGDVYDYKIIFELSISAYWVEKYIQSIELCDRLLDMKAGLPENIYQQTLKNRNFSLEKLKLV